jgi:hypothetical protein
VAGQSFFVERFLRRGPRLIPNCLGKGSRQAKGLLSAMKAIWTSKETERKKVFLLTEFFNFALTSLSIINKLRIFVIRKEIKNNVLLSL